MRRLVERTLGRPVEALLARLERGVQAGDHLRLARRALDPERGPLAAARLRSLPAEVAAAAGTVRSALASRLEGRDAAKDGAPVGGAQGPSAAALAELPRAPEGPVAAWAGLPCADVLPVEAPRASDDATLAAALGAAADDGPFAGEAPRPALATGSALALLEGLRAGHLTRPTARALARRLAGPVAPARWFRKAGVLPGSACLLRAWLAVEDPDDPVLDDVRERMLRHVEVRREDALALRATPSEPASARGALERLRFALTLLDVAERRRDGRFLNGALKLLDWQHAPLARRGFGEGTAAPLLGAHYAACVVRQERLLEALWP